MRFRVEFAKLNPGVPAHMWQVFDEPWVSTLDEALRSAQATANSRNSALMAGRERQAGWAYAEGESRVVGLEVLGHSRLHKFLREGPVVVNARFKCLECGARGRMSDSVPYQIVPEKGQPAECFEPEEKKNAKKAR